MVVFAKPKNAIKSHHHPFSIFHSEKSFFAFFFLCNNFIVLFFPQLVFYCRK